MIEILPAPDNVVAMRLSGTLTAEDYDLIVPAVDGALARHERIGVYLEMTGFTDISAGAMARDVRFFFTKLRDLGRFKRYAAVTDKNWMRLLVSAAQPFFPGIEGRVYGPGEQEAAMTWVAGAS